MPQKGNRNDDAEMRQEKAREREREKENATGTIFSTDIRANSIFTKT
jgi:hypothetical protein